MNTIISASVLNSDMSALGQELRRAENAGADWIHLDVMDGVFVDCITFGDYMIRALRPHSAIVFDTHLMVRDPSKLIVSFAKSGSDIITIHEESKCDHLSILKEIRSFGIKAGIAINPETPAERVFPYLEEVDMVLVMTVNPGYGGQGFIKETLPKITLIRNEAERRGLSELNIQVDGGINANTANAVKEAGANVLVAGTYLFKSSDMAEAVRELKVINN
ncbi:ribulose-5-phosphate-3-epimerase [Holotrichia oblita]|nr:ribulose-5-phosphate-3-epimerase [Holotrichia oblita]